MQHQDQQVAETLARYLAAIESGTVEALDALAPDPAIRDQIEVALAEGLPTPVFAPTAAEHAAAAVVAARVQAHLHTRLAPPSLTALRTARQFSLGALARAVDLPVDLLARIERGGVIAASIPARLAGALGAALAVAEREVAAALAAPPRPAAARLSARDGTSAAKEQPVTFEAALHASGATPAQRQFWGG